MRYIPRNLGEIISGYLDRPGPRGVVLTGLVGAGKTTLITRLCERLSQRFQVIKFTGDDLQFRVNASLDSRYILNEVRSRTTERALIFVDEIQKSSAILDNLKLAYDEGGYSFIVTGSNPAYLRHQALRRLQRRAVVFTLFPFSLNELFSFRGWVAAAGPKLFQGLILNELTPREFRYPDGRREPLLKALENYRHTGTIPFVLTGRTLKEKLQLLGQTVDRGLPPLEGVEQEVYDLILSELARLHEREFTYQNLLQKTRLKRREKIDKILAYLVDNGILYKRRRILFEEARTSYHFIPTFVDPGIVTYLTGRYNRTHDDGFDLQGLVRIGLENLRNFIPVRFELHYYRPYYITPSGQIKYRSGEIDIVLQIGERIIPMEVKSTASINRVDTHLLQQFIRERKADFGIVFYTGETFWDRQNLILYLPIWIL